MDTTKYDSFQNVIIKCVPPMFANSKLCKPLCLLFCSISAVLWILWINVKTVFDRTVCWQLNICRGREVRNIVGRKKYDSWHEKWKVGKYEKPKLTLGERKGGQLSCREQADMEIPPPLPTVFLNGQEYPVMTQKYPRFILKLFAPADLKWVPKEVG